MKNIGFLLTSLALSIANINFLKAQTMSNQTTTQNGDGVQQVTTSNKAFIQKGYQQCFQPVLQPAYRSPCLPGPESI